MSYTSWSLIREKHVLAKRLRAAYEALPPRHVRYSTLAGRDFQTLVFLAVDEYGVTGTAEILGLTHPAITAILKKKTVKDDDAVRWPDAHELEGLGTAWQSVVSANQRGRAVRAGSREYRAMQRALKPLLERYDLGVIARAGSIPLARLRRFAPDHPGRSTT